MQNKFGLWTREATLPVKEAQNITSAVKRSNVLRRCLFSSTLISSKPTSLVVPDPDKILTNCGYCLQKLVAMADM